jgi:hypothetical protein
MPSAAPTLSPTPSSNLTLPPSPSDQTEGSNSADDELSDGALAGIVIGSVVGVGALAALGFFLVPQASALYATPKVAPMG